MNVATIVVLLAVLSAVIGAFLTIIRNKKKGNSCCPNCSSCSGCSLYSNCTSDSKKDISETENNDSQAN